MRVASSLDEGQTFQLRRTPSRSSCAWIEDMSMVARRAAFARPGSTQPLSLRPVSREAVAAAAVMCSEDVLLQRVRPQLSNHRRHAAGLRGPKTLLFILSGSRALFLRRAVLRRGALLPVFEE